MRNFNKEREKYFNKLKSFCERYKNICNMGFIYDTKNLLELKQSPFDRGKDIFKQLVDKTNDVVDEKTATRLFEKLGLKHSEAGGNVP